MINRLIVLVLLGLLVAGLIRRWTRPAVTRTRARPIEAARKCPACEAYVLGASPEPCDRADCPYRPAAHG